MEQKRRQVLLADRYLRAPRDKLYLSRTLEQVERGIRTARKYVFDEDACIKIANIVMSEPKLLIREHHLAIAPFDQTWIEWPSWHYWMHIRKALGHDKWYHPGGTDSYEETADYEVGYLIDNGRVNVISAGKPSNPLGDTPRLSPIQYRLHTEWPIEDQLDFCRRSTLSRIGIDGWFWGSTWSELSEDERVILRGNNVAEVMPLNPAHPGYKIWNDDGGVMDMVRGSTGDLRTIIALLLVLNRHNITTESARVPHSRGFIKGKMITHSSHTKVRITLDDPVPEFRRSVAPGHSGISLRRHERSGSFRQNKVARDYAQIAGCLHEWVAANENYVPLREHTDSPTRCVCSACGGKQWFVPSYWTKGSEEGGIVIHDNYEVTR